MDKLKDEYILHIEGYWQKNTSYLEEANGSGNINETYELTEELDVIPFGYVVKVIRINNDSVELVVDKNVVTLKENERYYIVNRHYTSGKNEDFKVDNESLYIELVSKNDFLYPHLKTFIDKVEEIDKNIERVKCLLRNKYAYSEIQHHLQSVLFRINNEDFIKRYKDVDWIIKERELALPHKDIINSLINDIDVYFKENENLLDSILKSWMDAGITTPEGLQAEKQRQRGMRESRGQNNGNSRKGGLPEYDTKKENLDFLEW